MSIKLKSFDQFVSEMDRAEEIEKDIVDMGTPEDKDVEEVDDEAEEVQGHGELSESEETEEVEESVVNENKYAKAGKLGYNDQFLDRRKSLSKTLAMDLGLNPKHEFGGGDWLGFDHIALYATGGSKKGTILADALSGKYTYDELKAAAANFLGIKESATNEANEVEEDRAEEIEQEMKDMGTPKSLAEALTEMYEGMCKEEAKAYEEDAHDEHTVESYMKENAALIAALAAKSLKEMKEDYAVEAYEAACNEMIESYTKKMNEMKEMDSAEEASDVE
jgi:hypothetical protein